MYFLSVVYNRRKSVRYYFRALTGKDLRYDALKKKWTNDTVNDKFPAAAFVPRYPTLNSVYASLSKNNDLSHDSALAHKNGDA